MLGKHKTRVLLALELINSAYPQPCQGFGHEISQCKVRVYFTTALPALFYENQNCLGVVSKAKEVRVRRFLSVQADPMT